MVKRRILLVDDDVAVLLTLKTVLELNQFEVHTAASSAEAIDKLKGNVYQMVITDAHMETEDAGFHVLRAARSQPYNPATALLTAYPPHKSEPESKRAQSILIKPVGTEDLLRQIEALLVGHEDEKQLQDANRPTAHAATGMRRDNPRRHKKTV
ncbi:MAG: response regulator [Acidobacteriota bacterium]|nr:response regulator [Acidobacteriota bacterium]